MFVSFLIDDFPCQRSLYFLQARRNFSLPPSCHKVNIHMYESFVYTSVSDHCDEISYAVLLGFLLLNMIFIVPFVSFLVFLLDGTILIDFLLFCFVFWGKYFSCNLLFLSRLLLSSFTEIRQILRYFIIFCWSLSLRFWINFFFFNVLAGINDSSFFSLIFARKDPWLTL